MDDRIEYLLVLSLAPLGCLQDWLTDNRMPFGIFCRMGKSIANGLAHLHTEIRKGDLIKPCICHRDLNSRNILVKADLSCCICDLGFALKTFGPRYECRGEIALAETKSINEVGTLRYMAPEVLEGAVNLRDCESALKQIDVYSLGLVLWELATRCNDFYPDESTVPEYKAPYEDETGTNPNFEQMQVLVSRNKARPRFPTNYENSVASRVVKDTCEDCWDHDAEARLTALCVQERIQEITTMNPKAQLHKGQTPPLSTNNLIITTPTGHSRVSPTAVSFMTPPNQQIIPHTNQYCDTSTGTVNHPKIVNVPVDSRQKFIPNGIQRHSINDAYIPDEEDKFKSLTNAHQPDVMFSNPRGLPKLDNNETQRKIRGLNNVRAMLQKTFQKSQSYVQQDCDDKSNLVVNSLTYTVNLENYPSDLVNTNATSLHINMINSADNDIEKRTVERPTNLDLSSGSGRYEHNLIRSANESSKFKALADDFTSQPFTMIQSNSPNPKLRIVVSKSANAVKNLNSSRSSLSDQGSEDSKFMKRQRSLEVFHEVFGPKGSIERLRNPSQRVKTPGDVPPSVRKVRASKTLSLYDDRMMDTSRLANSV